MYGICSIFISNQRLDSIVVPKDLDKDNSYVIDTLWWKIENLHILLDVPDNRLKNSSFILDSGILTWFDSVEAQAWAKDLVPQKSLNRPPWNVLVKNRSWIVQNFQILIVSAVKFCKQCLQTASASGESPPDSLSYSPNKNLWRSHWLELHTSKII